MNDGAHRQDSRRFLGLGPEQPPFPALASARPTRPQVGPVEPLTHWLLRARGTFRRPPAYLARRALREATVRLDRFSSPRRASRLDICSIARRSAGLPNVNALWDALLERPFVAPSDSLDPAVVETVEPGEVERVLKAAGLGAQRVVDLLGSGPVALERPIRWAVDFKTGVEWPGGYFHTLPTTYPDASDVKVPWELSRLQWLLPAALAYRLTQDERHAQMVREVLEEWIAANPYAKSINWVSPMEAALRIVAWTYFFHVLGRSRSWADTTFRRVFLNALYLHGDFVARNLERSDVNGNHYTADAAGLVFAGSFFGVLGRAPAWSRLGWSILHEELPRQVYRDGVDFEASTAYHRFVCELFLLPALYRDRLGDEVPRPYRERIAAMARFAYAYSRRDGSSPLWGDADDARILPLGGQPLDDHRYLAGIVGSAWGFEDLRRRSGPARSEVLWLLGAKAAASVGGDESVGSTAFPDGGVFVMRGDDDHVFIDCGPVGLAGRGGHGHNDCLSFEASLGGIHLVTDCGSYVYTASLDLRDHFRSSVSHNSPIVDGEEQNRFVDPPSPWLLHDDASPRVLRWEAGVEADLFCGLHRGYCRLPSPVIPRRTIMLDKRAHSLMIRDEFEGHGEHEVAVPVHLAAGVVAGVGVCGAILIEASGRTYRLSYADPDDWSVNIGSAWASPSYGVRLPIVRLAFRRVGVLRPLEITVAPTSRAGASRQPIIDPGRTRRSRQRG